MTSPAGPAPAAGLVARGNKTAAEIDGLRSLCAREAVEVVPVSARTMLEMQWLVTCAFDSRSYVCEGGALAVAGTRYDRNTGSWQESEEKGTVAEQIAASGVRGHVLQRWGQQLSWLPADNEYRSVGQVFRGTVDCDEVSARLREFGYDLHLVDDGPAAGVGRVAGRQLSLLPAGVSKSAGVERHRGIVGNRRERTFAIVASLHGLMLAPEVGTCWVMPDALSDAEIRQVVHERPAVEFAVAPAGASVLLQVVETMVQRWKEEG